MTKKQRKLTANKNATAQIKAKDRPRALVLGGSVAGLMSTLVLAKKGFEVVLYEQRGDYIRNIQWGVRQSFIDYLACIDQEIADEFFDNLASVIKNGHIFLADESSVYEDGAHRHRQRAAPHPGVCMDQDRSALQTLGEEIVCLVPAKKLEKFLYEKAKNNAAVTIRHTTAPPLEHETGSDQYYLKDKGTRIPYDLIVVSEGASSKTRTAVGIKSMNLSRGVKQVSGQVNLERHGMILEYLHAINHEDKVREELLLSLLISTDGHKSCWIVGDVSSACLTSLNAVPPNSPEAKAIVQKEFRKIAARTMISAEQNIEEAGYKGVVREVKLFTLQAQISNKAVAGSNLVLAGDAVGVGHWNVGGGMHVAAVCHTTRLEVLASSILEDRGNKIAALKEYNSGALEDTIAWISSGFGYYYMSIPGDVMEAIFDELIVELMNDNTFSFLDQLKSRVSSIYLGE